MEHGKGSAPMSSEGFDQREGLILAYKGYVKSLVGGLVKALNLPNPHFDDFAAAGFLGLVEAAESFDFKRGSSFKSYAFHRIRGAVIDSIRKCSELQGKAYRLSRVLEAVQDVREMMRHEENIEDPTNNDDALAKLLEYAGKGALAYRLSMCEAEEEVVSIPDETPTPQEALELREESEKLQRLIQRLPKDERILMQQYYFKQKSLEEVGEEQGLGSKSWCSRLHAKALGHLKELYVKDRS